MSIVNFGMFHTEEGPYTRNVCVFHKMTLLYVSTVSVFIFIFFWKFI